MISGTLCFQNNVFVLRIWYDYNLRELERVSALMFSSWVPSSWDLINPPEVTTAKCKLKLGFYRRLGTFVLHFRVLMLNNSYMGEVTFRFNQQLLKTSCLCFVTSIHFIELLKKSPHQPTHTTGHFWLSFWIPAGGWCFYMVTFLLFQSFGFREGDGQYKSKNLKGQLGPSENHEMFDQEKLYLNCSQNELNVCWCRVTLIVG